MAYNRIIVACCLAITIVVLAQGASAAGAAFNPVVFVHYMHCYIPGSFSPSDDHIANYRRDYGAAQAPPVEVESQWFSEDVEATITGGLATVQADLSRLAASHVDAVGLLIAPSHLPNSQFADALNMVAEAAIRSTVKVIPELWADLLRTDVDAYGRDLAEMLDAHKGAQMEFQGKPVFLISEQRPDGGGLQAVEASKERLDRLFRRWGGREKVYLIVNLGFGETNIGANSYATLADALGAWTPQDDWTSRRAQASGEAARAAGKPYVYPVSYGFYQRRAGLPPWEYGDSFGAERLIEAWSHAFAARPQFVELMTWNDFSEDTAFAPSTSHGHTFLDLTRYLLEVAERRVAPIPARDSVMLFHPRQLVTARLDAADATVTNYAWRHVAPMVDWIDVVSILKAPGRLRLALGDEVWERDAPAGLSQWLLIADLPHPRARGDWVNAGPSSFPTSTDTRLVQNVSRFPATLPIATLQREGRGVLTVVSRAPLLDHGPYQDLTIIGDEAEGQ